MTTTANDQGIADRSSPRWLAAEARQLFRAHQAADAQALELIWFHFPTLVRSVLDCHLRVDPRWDPERRDPEVFDVNRDWWIDFLSNRADPIVSPEVRIFLRGLAFGYGYQGGYEGEPFTFELRLNPEDRGTCRYEFRFGNPEHFLPSNSHAVGEPWAFILDERSPKAPFKPGTGPGIMTAQAAEKRKAEIDAEIAMWERQVERARADSDAAAEQVALFYLHCCMISGRRRDYLFPPT